MSLISKNAPSLGTKGSEVRILPGAPFQFCLLKIGLERRLEGRFMGLREACGGPFIPSRRLHAHCFLCLIFCRCAMSLCGRVKLWAAELKTNRGSTFSSPRSLSWRSGPVCFSQPKTFSTSHLRLRLIAYPGWRVVRRSRLRRRPFSFFVTCGVTFSSRPWPQNPSCHRPCRRPR